MTVPVGLGQPASESVCKQFGALRQKKNGLRLESSILFDSFRSPFGRPFGRL